MKASKFSDARKAFIVRQASGSSSGAIVMRFDILRPTRRAARSNRARNAPNAPQRSHRSQPDPMSMPCMDDQSPQKSVALMTQQD